MKKQLRMTHQREIILSELDKCNNHPTADELYERVRLLLPRISLATVYRNLEILSLEGLVKKLATSGRQKRFDSDLDKHNHIYCVQCHRVDNLIKDPVKTISLSSEQSRGYKIAGCRIEFFGICPQCKKKV